MEYFIDSGDRPAFIKFPMVSVFLFVFLFLLIAIEITVSAIDAITYSLLTDEQKAKLEEASSVSLGESDWYKNLMKKLTKSAPIEKEGSCFWITIMMEFVSWIIACHRGGCIYSILVLFLPLCI